MATYLMPTKTSTCSGYEKDGVPEEWKSKVNMSPLARKFVENDNQGNPKLYYDHISIQDVEQKIRADGMDRYTVANLSDQATEEERIVYYLYGSGFAANDTIPNRKARVQTFLQGGAKHRMLEIIRKERDQIGDESLWELWLKVQTCILLYQKLNGVKTFFRGKEIPYVGRVQASKNCYLHGSSGIVGYKIALGEANNNYKANSVDVSKLVHHAYHDRYLECRVVANKGGKSENLLKQLIAGSGARLHPNCLADDLKIHHAVEDFDHYGPALVSRFRVDNDFRAKKNLSPPDNGDRTYYIHQFDYIGGSAVHRFFPLGEKTDAEQGIIDVILLGEHGLVGYRFAHYSRRLCVHFYRHNRNDRELTFGFPRP